MTIDLTTLDPVRRKQLETHTRHDQRHKSKSLLPCPRVGLAYLIMHKCGATTSVKHIRDEHGVPVVGLAEFNEKYSDLKVVTHWREPFSRMESMYRYAQKVKTDVPAFIPRWDCPFAEWVLEICSEPVDAWYDLHIGSQTYLDRTPLGRPADIRVAWDFPRLWEMFEVPGTPEVMNPSDHSIETVWTVPAISAFERTYDDDLSLWEGMVNAQ